MEFFNHTSDNYDKLSDVDPIIFSSIRKLLPHREPIVIRNT
jgi:hypothetical protein